MLSEPNHRSYWTRSRSAWPRLLLPPPGGTRRKARRNVTVGVAHIKATFNNTTVTITDTKSDTLCWSSAGTSGFRGSRKSTPFAGQLAAQQAAEKAIKYGVKELDVKVKGRAAGGKARSPPCRPRG